MMYEVLLSLVIRYCQPMLTKLKIICCLTPPTLFLHGLGRVTCVTSVLSSLNFGTDPGGSSFCIFGCYAALQEAHLKTIMHSRP